MTNEHPSTPSEPAVRAPRRWLRISLVSALALVLLVGGLALTLAPHAALAGLFRAHRHGFDAEHLRFGVEWMLRDTEATEEQVERIVAIAESAHQDLHGLRGDREEHLAAFAAALSGDEVDRAAVEAQRARFVAMAEQASRRIADALAESAEVLTPEQRATLIERLREHEHGHGPRHFGGGRF